MYLRRWATGHSRGQAAVEFAIILPLLAILLVMAIDAGRLFFGWVALQNASRIGADYATTHASAWDGTPDPLEASQRAQYTFLVLQDLQAVSCDNPQVPAPNFDPDGDGTSDYSDGALARVDLFCDFHPLTPLAEGFLGQPLVLHSFSDFAINRTLAAGLPPPVNPPPALGCDPGEARVPVLVGERMQDANALWTGAGFTGGYAPAVTNANKNRTVLTQSLADGDCQPLTSAVAVTY